MSTKLTQTQKGLIDELSSVLSADTKSFTCSGILDDRQIDLSKLRLYYTSQNTSEEPTFHAEDFPLKDDAAARIYAAGKPSHFGKGEESVHDETYRMAHELKPPLFALSYDLIAQSSILTELFRHLQLDVPFKAVPSKLNAYPTGGFFKAHRDTPLGSTHIGTLTICLPTSFTGGDLVVRHNGQAVHYDWCNQVNALGGAIAWAFLFADCEHEVLPVESGLRITIAYDIFSDVLPESVAPKDTRSDALVRLFRSLLDPTTAFMMGGGEVAFGLKHHYPVPKPKSWRDFRKPVAPVLKGTDALLLKALKGLGLQMSFKAIYPDEGDHDCDTEVKMSEDPYDPLYYMREFVFGMDHFDGMGSLYMDEGDSAAPMCAGEKGFTMDIFWIAPPQRWDHKTAYIGCYMNEPNVYEVYVGIALVVTIPALVERPALIEDITSAIARAKEMGSKRPSEDGEVDSSKPKKKKKSKRSKHSKKAKATV